MTNLDVCKSCGKLRGVSVHTGKCDVCSCLDRYVAEIQAFIKSCGLPIKYVLPPDDDQE